MAKRVKPNCNHSHIKDAVATARGQRMDIIGVITEHGIREKSTRGTDWFCVVKIMDESYQGYGISVNVFANDVGNLPQIRSPGDIIHFSRVTVQTTNPYYKGYEKDYIAFNKNGSGFALFEGKSGSDLIPYQVSPTYDRGEAEKDCITLLRTWLLNNHITSGTNSSILPLTQISEGKPFDLVCKVFKVCEVDKDVWKLYVWDGTDAPPLLCRKKLSDELEDLLPLDLDQMQLSRDVMCGFPAVGTTLGVNFRVMGQDIIQLNSRWIKLVDLRCKEVSGLWVGVSSPRLRLLSGEDDIVISRQRAFEERLSVIDGHLPLSASPWLSHITVTNRKKVPCASLMYTLTRTEVTCKVKCAVRVLDIIPSQVEDFRSHREPKFYRIMLTLEDPTARIRAYLYAEDAEMFFGGFPAEDELIGVRNKLLGVANREDGSADLDGPRNPPWIQVCLKCYYIEKEDPWNTRAYRIFDTKFVA